MTSDPLDIPPYLKIPAERRAEAWRDYVARMGAHSRPRSGDDTAKREEEPATRALREQLERAAAAKKAEGLEKLRKWKAANPLLHKPRKANRRKP